MLLISSGALGGGEETVRLLAVYLDKNLFDITVVCPASPLSESLQGIPGVACRTAWFPRLPTPKAVSQLTNLIREVRPDILHTHLYHGDLYGWLATRKAHVPRLVSTVQGVNFFWEMERGIRRLRWRLCSLLYRQIYRAFDAVAVCSSAVREQITTRPGIRIPAGKITVIHNSMDPEKLRAALEKGAATRQNGRSKRIISVANLLPFKGHEVLLEAVNRLRSMLDVECLIVGEGPERKRLETRCRELGIEKRVRFLGSRPDVVNLLHDSDLFVLPSLWEPFGIAIVEAMAAGIPVVAAGGGGIPEIIQDGVNGLLVRPGDPEALAANIRKLLSASSVRTALTKHAKETVQKNFGAPSMAAAYAGWYGGIHR
ncbi:MAG: glycosyltransferase family 4 protein [Candidatus Omnitrophica bacterium]|nr:glycosyltransferase family 4 protein [Candidatus Omnitrophota bacterium]